MDKKVIRRCFSLILAVILTISTCMFGWAQEVYASAPKDLALKFDENVNGTFYFSGDRTGVTGNELFYGKVIVDEEEIGMFFTPDGNNRYVIANSWLGAKAPENTFQIVAGTEFKQLNSWSDQSEKADGMTLKISNTLTVEKKGYEWIGVRETSNLNKTFHLDTVNEGNEVMFTTDITDIPSGYYTTVVNIDGKECKVPIQRSASSGKFVIWYNMFTLFGGTKPTASLVIPKGAVLRQVDTSQNWSVITGGARVELTNTLTIQKVDGAWTEKIETTKEIHLSTVNTGSEWIFSIDATGLTGTYYLMPAKIDGVNMLVPVRVKDNALYMYCNLVGNTQGKVPEQSMEIPKGTILKQIVPEQGWTTPTVGGQWIETTNTLKIGIVDGEWKEITDTIKKEVHLSTVNTGNEWIFSTDATGLTGTFYLMPAKIDGEDMQVPVRVKDNALYMYCNLVGNTQGKVPEQSMEIPKGTILKQIVPEQGWTTPTVGGQWIETTNTLKIGIVDGEWTEIIDTIKKEIHLNTVNTGNEWIFSTDAIGLTGTYYLMPAKIDGEEMQVPVRVKENALYMYCNLVGNTQGKVPEQSMEIPKGTILKQIVPEQGWTTPTVDGQWIEIANTLKIEMISGEWTEIIDTTKKEIHLSTVNIGNEWIFSTDVTGITGTFYLMPAKIDGEDMQIPVRVKGNALYMYCNLVGNTQGKVPEESMEIPKGTILKQIVPEQGWTTPTVGGQWIETTNTLKLELYNGEWTDADKLAGATETKLYLSNVNSDPSWYLAIDDNVEITGQYFMTTVKIDGEDVKVSVAKSGNRFVIWSSFFNTIQTDKTAPTRTFEITQGTVLKEIVHPDTAKNWTTISSNGQWFKITDTLTVELHNGEWTDMVQLENTLKTQLHLNRVNDDPSWLLTMDDIEDVTGKYYLTTVKIDGQEVKVPFGFDSTTQQFVIWTNFFGIFGGKVPTGKMEVPKGTVLKEIVHPDTAHDWVTLEADGQWFETTNDFSASLTEYGWYEYPEKLKKPVQLELNFVQGLLDGSLGFEGKLQGAELEKGRYRAKAVIDGEEKDIIISYSESDERFYVYQHFFTPIPGVGSKIPQESFTIAADTILIPVSEETWQTDFTKQAYRLGKTLHIDKVSQPQGKIWMDAAYKENVAKNTTLKMKIAFQQVHVGTILFKNQLSTGKKLYDLYANEKFGYGFGYGYVKCLSMNAKEYQDTYLQFKIENGQIRLEGATLSALDAIQIDAGTLIYPAGFCKSIRPIEITHNFRLIRNTDDEWEIDTDFSDIYDLEEKIEIAEKVENEETKEDKDNVKGEQEIADACFDVSKVIVDKRAEGDISAIDSEEKAFNIPLFIVIAAIVLAGGTSIGALLIAGRKKKS